MRIRLSDPVVLFTIGLGIFVGLLTQSLGSMPTELGIPFMVVLVSLIATRVMRGENVAFAFEANPTVSLYLRVFNGALVGTIIMGLWAPGLWSDDLARMLPAMIAWMATLFAVSLLIFIDLMRHVFGMAAFADSRDKAFGHWIIAHTSALRWTAAVALLIATVAFVVAVVGYSMTALQLCVLFAAVMAIAGPLTVMAKNRYAVKA